MRWARPHTAGDVVVHLPDEGVVFTGDILFHGGHPIVWAGPVSNWIAACDRILALDPTVVVPGHGPLADPAAVADLKDYFEYLTVEARRRFDAGMGATEAARDIDLGPYSGWSEDERVVVNVGCLYREFGAAMGGRHRESDGQYGCLGGRGQLTARLPRQKCETHKPPRVVHVEIHQDDGLPRAKGHLSTEYRNSG